jgi:hypothetical protein
VVVVVVVTGAVVVVEAGVAGGYSSTSNGRWETVVASRDAYVLPSLLVLRMTSVTIPVAPLSAAVTSTVSGCPDVTCPKLLNGCARSGTQGDVSRPSSSPSRLVSTSFHLRPGPPALLVVVPSRSPSIQAESSAR